MEENTDPNSQLYKLPCVAPCLPSLEVLIIFLFVYHKNTCTVGQKERKYQNTSINSNKNYPREMELVPINMDYSQLQFDASKIFLGVCLHAGMQICKSA